jgi:hypothetical protein
MFVTCNVIEINYFIFKVIWMNLTSESINHLKFKCRFYLRETVHQGKKAVDFEAS